MKMRICCFGELLLRLSPVFNRQWIANETIATYVGGAELNVATALSNWNMPVKYCSALPNHTISKELVEELESKGIETTAIQYSGNRVGIYYLPQGADLKNEGVIYDRSGSSFSALTPGMIDWENVFKNCTWFHFSAISPALNENVAAVCKEALIAASKMGLTISVDLNYRSKLWKYGKSPLDVMPELVSYCHVIMGNIWSAADLLGTVLPITNSDGKTANELAAAATASMTDLVEKYPQANTIAYTFRLKNEYWATIQQGLNRTVSNVFITDNAIENAGSGDCFMAGLIYGLINKHSDNQTINFAAAAAVGKLYEKGDASRNTIEQVNSIIKHGNRGKYS